jgi:hypothetical protein
MGSSELDNTHARIDPIRLAQDQAISAQEEARTSGERTERRFRDLADRWHRETRLLSSVSKMSMHPAYQQIIGMGAAAIPLILRELEQTRDHWLWALYAM